MGLIGNLFRRVGSKLGTGRTWTPVEVRDLMQAGRIAEAQRAVDDLSPATPDRGLVALCLKGEIAFHGHQDVDAERLFRQALSHSPGFSDAHYGLSILMLERGEKEAALRHAQFAANAGRDARFSAQLGLCQLEMSNLSLAESALARAARLDTHDKASWNNLGIVRRAQGDVPGALQCFQRALEIDPKFERAKGNLAELQREMDAAGVMVGGRATSDDASSEGDFRGLADVRALADQGRVDEAIDLCEKLSLQLPDVVSLPGELYKLYRRRGDVQSGLDVLTAFRARHPDNVEATSALARAFVAEREFKTALSLVLWVLEKQPDDVDMLMALASIRAEEMRYAEAGSHIERALVLKPSIDIKGALAANQLMRCQYDKALVTAAEVVAERPRAAAEMAGIQIYALTHLGRHDEALPLIEQAIQENPNDPNRRFPRASINLLHERFAEGWDDYAFRNLSSTKHLRMLPFPQWAGEALDGKTVIVLADQGLGDQVMFASCLPDLIRRRPARVIVEVNARLAKIMARSFPTCEIVPSRQDNGFEWVRPLGAIDCFIPIGDLPQQFRRQRSDFPDHRGYLVPDADRVEYWRGALAQLGDGPKIGVSWRGGTEQTRQVMRTMDVTALAGLAPACAAAKWVCLQYGEVREEVERARSQGWPLHHWQEAIQDLDEFAALVSALDLVITVCNTTVHFAGALAKEVLVLAPRIPEWRYGLTSASLPWYPSSRVFRQQVDGDWNGPLASVNAELKQRSH